MPATDVAGKLDQGMLTPAACAEKRPAGFAGEADGVEHAVHVAYGLPGTAHRAENHQIARRILIFAGVIIPM